MVGNAGSKQGDIEVILALKVRIELPPPLGVFHVSPWIKTFHLMKKICPARFVEEEKKKSDF